MASKDTLCAVLLIERFRGSASTKELEPHRTIANIDQFKLVEPKLAANTSGYTVSLAELGGTVHGYVIVTPKKIGVHKNGGSAETCSSILANFDTTLTSLVLDNNLLGDPGEEVKPEVWLWCV